MFEVMEVSEGTPEFDDPPIELLSVLVFTTGVMLEPAFVVSVSDAIPEFEDPIAVLVLTTGMSMGLTLDEPVVLSAIEVDDESDDTIGRFFETGIIGMEFVVVSEVIGDALIEVEDEPDDTTGRFFETGMTGMEFVVASEVEEFVAGRLITEFEDPVTVLVETAGMITGLMFEMLVVLVVIGATELIDDDEILGGLEITVPPELIIGAGCLKTFGLLGLKDPLPIVDFIGGL